MKSRYLLLSLLFLTSCVSENLSNFKTKESASSETNEIISESTSNSSFVSTYESVSSSLSSSESYFIDPYEGVSYEEFYASYTEATSYLDAYYRTKHGFMSGSIDVFSVEPVVNQVIYNGNVCHFSNHNYTYDENGNIVGYLINTKEGTYKEIYYNAAYVSLEEVAAYVYAFGEVPPNSNYSKNNKQNAISDWGEFGRVNVARFTNNVSKYPFQPELPLSGNSMNYFYTEIDIGALDGYYMSTGSYVDEYNDGSYITRGVLRLVYTSTYTNGEDVPVDDRHVFYTYNHYNDFQEYLNYHNGWSNRFGNESSGNPYFSNQAEFNSYPGHSEPTQYEPALIIDKNSF